MVRETKYSGTKVQQYNSKLYGTPVLAKGLTSDAKQHIVQFVCIKNMVWWILVTIDNYSRFHLIFGRTEQSMQCK